MFKRKAQAAREANPIKRLPYSHHVDENVVACDNGELLAVFQIEGLPFETLDIWEINSWHETLNIALRSIADDHLAVQSFLLRRQRREYPTGRYSSRFSRDLDEGYRESVSSERMYVNDLYLAVMHRKSVGKADKVGNNILSILLKNEDQGEGERADRLADFRGVLNDVGKLLGKVSPRLLSTYEERGLAFSEVLEFLNGVMLGRRRKVPLVRGHLGNALYSDRLIFGNEAVEIREPGSSRYAGMFGVREHAARTFPGMLNGLLAVDFELVLSQSFCFVSKTESLETTRRKAGQLAATDDVAISQADELQEAMDALQSNVFVLGEHALQLTVFGDTIKSLNENMSVARAVLSEGGTVAAREDMALEAAYWAQLPTNFAMRPRPALITSRNFAALAPFHTYPVGKRTGNHWGDAVCLLKTSSLSPYYFNFHVADIGHTLILGPTGAGKTVLQTFLQSQAEKLGPRQFFIDKDRGAEIYVRATGGTYLTLENGKPTGFAPLKAINVETPRGRAFLGRWLRLLVAEKGRQFTAQEEEMLDSALKALARLPKEERSLSVIRSALPTTSEEGIGPRLERWCAGSELGWVFDNDTDLLTLDVERAGFDMTNFLDNDTIRPAVMSYLFERIDMEIDGRPAIITIDEFWKALGDEAFTSFAQDGLKTYRKRNAMMLFGTQSPADALRSDISHTIIEQCATKILLPNPAAQKEHYMDGLDLSEAEFRMIKTELTAESRRFLIKQGHNSVVAELDLGAMPNELAVLSGRASTVELVTRLREELGDDPDVWLPRFHAEREDLR